MPVYGFAAAGWTTFACYGFMAGGHYVFMRRVRRERGCSPSVYNDKLLFAIVVALFAFGLVMLAVYGLPVVRYALVLLTLVVAFVKKDALMGIYRQLKK